ncbi:alpha/beta fold hydrolase [Kribbella sp. CA-247076]|uniref:alpha/beta fold hydrolase n=1 Tax=Kribbella sp. CA-247076 TaxID=3239941 RepID=UPI003D932A8C
MHEYVALNGARIAYRVSGDGPALVLLKNNRRPLDFPAALELSRRFRVVQLQPVGFGAADRPDTYDFGSIGEQVLAVLDHLSINHFAVWGFSQTAAMAALTACATSRATALVMGGFTPFNFPTDTEMRRLEREPRLPHSALAFWRAYRSHDWHHELRDLSTPALVYIGTADPAIKRMRHQAAVLKSLGCTYLELPDLNHHTTSLSAPTNTALLNSITGWLNDRI